MNQIHGRKDSKAQLGMKEKKKITKLKIKGIANKNYFFFIKHTILFNYRLIIIKKYLHGGNAKSIQNKQEL